MAFDTSGNTNWTVANYNPQMATADGSTIAQSLDGTTTTTFDANGNATGQLPSLPTYSWKGAYQLGSIESLAIPSPTVAGQPGVCFSLCAF